MLAAAWLLTAVSWWLPHCGLAADTATHSPRGNSGPTQRNSDHMSFSSSAKRIPTRDSGLQPLTHALLVSPATARASEIGGTVASRRDSDRDDEHTDLSNSSSFSSQHSDSEWNSAGEPVAAASAYPRVAHAYSSNNALMAAPTAGASSSAAVHALPPVPLIDWLRCGNHLFSLGSLGCFLMNFARVLIGTDNVSGSLSTADFLALSLMFIGSSLCYAIDVSGFPLEWTRRRFYHPSKRVGVQEEPQEEQFITGPGSFASVESSLRTGTDRNTGSVNLAAAAFSKRPAFAPVFSSRDFAAADDDADASFDPEDDGGTGVRHSGEKLRGYGQGGGMMHAPSAAGRSFGGMRKPDESQVSSPRKRLVESAENSGTDAAAAESSAAARRARWWPLRAETWCEVLNMLGALLNMVACAMPYLIPSMDPSKGVNLNSVPLSIAVVDLISQIVWLLSALGGGWVWHRDRIQVAREKFVRVQRGLARAAAQQSREAQGEEFLEDSSMPTRKSIRSKVASAPQSDQPVFQPSSVKWSWVSFNSLGWWVCFTNISGCLLYVAASIYGMNTSVVVLNQTKTKQYRDGPPAGTDPAMALTTGIAEGAWAYIYSGASYARYQLLQGSFGLGGGGGSHPGPSPDPHPIHPTHPSKLVPQWSVSPQIVQTLVHQQRVLNLAGDCVFLCCALFCELEYYYGVYNEMGANHAGSAAAGARMRRKHGGSVDEPAPAGSAAKSKSPSAVRRMPVSTAHPPSALQQHLLADAAEHGGGGSVSGSLGGPFGATPYDSADSSMSNSYRFTTAFVGPASVASQVGTMPGLAHWRKPSDAAAAAPSFDGAGTTSYSRAAPHRYHSNS